MWTIYSSQNYFLLNGEPADLANLTDISEEPDLYVQKVIHQAELEVNEEGSEAAAATAVLIGTRTASLPNKRPREFRVNRPFAFVIQDRSLGVPLFMGRIVDPREEQSSGKIFLLRITQV